jgi:two-component system, NarL family, response regulator DegU
VGSAFSRSLPEPHGAPDQRRGSFLPALDPGVITPVRMPGGASAGVRKHMRGAERIQLSLVSSNRLLRESLARLLRKKEDIYVVRVTHCTPEILQEIAKPPCDVLLLDGCPSDIGGRPLLPELLQRRPRLKIILLGMEESEPLFLRSVREGAAGYLLQDASAADVVAAVRAVMQDEAVCPPRLCWALFRHMMRQAAALPNLQIRVRLGLTRRQQQLLPLIAQGLTNKEIAALLNLSEQTIKNHIHRMLQRVGADDRLAVVELCRSQGQLV